MFDPTVFDNLKVAFENDLYDLDNLDHRITIADRKDTLEMSVMEREFRLKFHLVDQPEVSAEVGIHASLKDLAAEILEQPDIVPGCSLTIRFYMMISNEQEQCNKIEAILREIWEPAAALRQTLSHTYAAESESKSAGWSNVIELNFFRHINEEQMGDIPELVQSMLESLEKLTAVASI